MFDYFGLHPREILQALFIPACIQLASFILGVFLNNIIRRQLQERLTEEAHPLRYVFINALQGVPIAWCSGVGLYWTINALDIAPAITRMLSYILFTIIVFTATRVFARTIAGMITLHTERSDTNLPKTSLLTNIVNILIYLLGIIVVLQYYGISIAPIITALGVGGMALALGLQETMANMFAGLYLILSKQVRIGDFVKLNTNEEGCVTDITWRFTTIQSTAGNDIIVPNQKIASAILTNYNRPVAEVSISIGVGVSYDSDLDRVEQITLEVAREVMEKIDPGNSFDPSVRFHTFAASSINFNVNLRTHQFMNQYLLKHEFIKALTARYRQEGICIPYPIQTILQPEDAGKKIF